MNKQERLDHHVERQFENWGVWHERHHTAPHDGLQEVLGSEPQNRAGYIEALRARLGSTNLKQRTGAIALLREVAGDLGADTALAALLSAPLTPGEAPAWHISGLDLEQTAADALASKLTRSDQNTIAWLKKLAPDPRHKSFILTSLAKVDPDWLFANIDLVGHRHLALLTALPEERRFELIDALAPWPPERPNMITNFFWAQLPADEAKRLRGRMWPE